MTCSSPLSFGALVDYFAGDLELSAMERVEKHLFGCADCSAAAERVAQMSEAIRSSLPPVVTAEQVEDMHAFGYRVVEGTFVPGERRGAVFAPGVDYLVHRLSGLPLADAERVHLVVRSETSGVIAEEPYAPFERERGEVLVACQRHFANLPPDVVFDVHVVRRGGERVSCSYYVPHAFAPG